MRNWYSNYQVLLDRGTTELADVDRKFGKSDASFVRAGRFRPAFPGTGQQLPTRFSAHVRLEILP